MRNIMICAIVLCLMVCGSLTRADDKPTTRPSSAVLHPGDKDALAAAADKDVVIEGKIDNASWSSSGKVMKATFEGGADSKLSVIIFSTNKDKFDKAFSGDVSKTLTGAKVRLRGHLKDYKGAPELVLDNVDQITIVEASSPATEPTREER